MNLSLSRCSLHLSALSVSLSFMLYHFIFLTRQRCIIKLAASLVRCFSAICEVTEQTNKARESRRPSRDRALASLLLPWPHSSEESLGPSEPRLDKYFSCAFAWFESVSVTRRTSKICLLLAGHWHPFICLRGGSLLCSPAIEIFLLFSFLTNSIFVLYQHLWTYSHMTGEFEPCCVFNGSLSHAVSVCVCQMILPGSERAGSNCSV